MTIKRMFSSEIVRDFEFIDMPLSAQALYFQLGMETDNRGYISNGLSVMKLIGAKKEDLQTLIQRKYILIRGEKLLLQKHFPRNNGNIRPDRCTETTFIEDFRNIYLNENGDYTERDTGIKALEKKPFKTTPGLLPESSRTSPTQIEEKRKEENRKEVNRIEGNINDSGNIAYLDTNTSNNASDIYSDSEEVEMRKKLVEQQAEALKEVNYGN